MICICLFSYLTINYLIKYDIAVAKQIKCIGISFFQVPLFLFIIFTVYTMLPFQLGYAVGLSVISSLSHIIVLSLRLTINTHPQIPFLANQVKSLRTKPLFCKP